MSVQVFKQLHKSVPTELKENSQCKTKLIKLYRSSFAWVNEASEQDWSQDSLLKVWSYCKIAEENRTPRKLPSSSHPLFKGMNRCDIYPSEPDCFPPGVIGMVDAWIYFKHTISSCYYGKISWDEKSCLSDSCISGILCLVDQHLTLSICDRSWGCSRRRTASSLPPPSQ